MEFSIPFSGRAHQYSDAEVAVVTEAMKNTVPLTQGNHLKQFENKFKNYVGANHAFAVSNATVALELAAQLCQLSRDDEVIIPTHTFTSSAYPFARTGAKLVWADIDLATRVVTAETIIPCLSSRTKVIVVPHLYGYGASMVDIMALAKEHNLLVVEDAAQAVGVSVDGQYAGTFGDFGIYSFHSHKNISTLGEGGMLVLQSSDIAKVVPLLRHNGHCDFPFERADYWKPAMGNVDFPVLNTRRLWPMNACLGEVECAVGEKLLDRVDQINEEKRRRAIQFIDNLNAYPELVFHREDTTRHNYHLLTAMVTNDLRDQFIRRMADHHRIQCVVQYCPLNRYPFYSTLGFGEANCPKTDLFYDNMVSFPFHHMLTDSQISLIIDSAKETLDWIRSQ